MRDVIKQPHVGDRLDTGRYGTVTVRAVMESGQSLVVSDRIGQQWTIERAPRGHWVRIGHRTAARAGDRRRKPRRDRMGRFA